MTDIRSWEKEMNNIPVTRTEILKRIPAQDPYEADRLMESLIEQGYLEKITLPLPSGYEGLRLSLEEQFATDDTQALYWVLRALPMDAASVFVEQTQQKPA